MNQPTSLAGLQVAIEAGPVASEVLRQTLAVLPLAELAKLIHWLGQRQAAPAADDDALWQQIVAAAETRLLKGPPATHTELREAARQCYLQLPAASPLRGGMLRILAAMAGTAELRALAELLACDAPASGQACALGLSPLLRRKRIDPAGLFPRLLDTLANPHVAPAALDVMNYLTRERVVAEHPATSRREELASLLGEVAGRLASIEQRGEPPSDPIQQQVREGVALAVALCDALAQIGDPRSVGKLRQALAITHRRIHVEAAFALAKLGQEEGQAILLELAAEPSARLRVLSYAGELGFLDQLDPAFRTPAAMAEAELASWLAEPLQLGMPPHRLELVDEREQYWPSYDEPVACFLFRFSYLLPGGELSNIGIAGPLTMAFSADLGDLPPETIYAAFAGWQAEHADIYEVPIESLSGRSLRTAERYAARLAAEGFSDAAPIALGFFFEHRVLIAAAKRNGVAGLAAVDEEQIDWRPTQFSNRPLTPRDVYSIYKGKRLLATFNP